MTDADEDLAQAIVAAWKADKVLPGLFAELPAQKLKKDPAAPRTSKKMPYAEFEIKKGKENERLTGGAYHDFRDVTITLVGIKADVQAAKVVVLNVFGLALMPTGTPPPAPTLTMPSGARFVRWWPKNDGDIEPDPSSKEGQDIWRVVVKGEVWTVRTL
jgi:hypothetical protein